MTFENVGSSNLTALTGTIPFNATPRGLAMDRIRKAAKELKATVDEEDLKLCNTTTLKFIACKLEMALPKEK